MIDHEARRKYVGASEAAALFGLHPYITARELYYYKRSELDALPENKQIKRGRMLESSLASAYGEEFNVPIAVHQQTTYCPDLPGFAATPDYIDGAGDPIEFKTVRFLKDTGQPGEQHIIQLQGQLMCLQKRHGTLIYYDMIRDEFFVFHYQADLTIQNLIRTAVGRFWKAVQESAPPAVVAEDIDVLNRYFSVDKAKEVDLTGDNQLTDALGRYDALHKKAKEATKELEQVKATIKDKMGDAALVKCGDFIAKQTIVHMKEHVRKASEQRRLSIKNLNKGVENDGE